MIRFGTGGWRAIIGDDFTKDNLYKVAEAISEILIEDNKADKPVVIGYDRRFLSKEAALWLSLVFAGNGIRVKLMKRSSPSPLVMFLVKEQELHIGLEVTASHNPYLYNGVKVITEEGRDADVATTSRIERVIEGLTKISVMDQEEAFASARVSYIEDPFGNYIDHILSVLDQEKIRRAGLRVIFSPMHGSGIYPAEVILNSCRVTLDTIDSNKDAFFDGQYPAPSEATLQGLRAKVLSGGYDFGFAFDGDGDRLAVIDEKGRYISMNEILAMLYYYLHERKGWRGPVVKNLVTTHILSRMAKAFGEECIEVPVGFKWVSSALDEHDAILGGESSGGLTVRGHIYGKDAIYAVSLFTEMVADFGLSVSAISRLIEEKFGRTVFLEVALRFRPERKSVITAALLEKKRLPSFSYEIDHISYMDGVKVYFKDDSFVSCRFSGTEPLLRIMAEAENQELADSYIKAFEDFVEELM